MEDITHIALNYGDGIGPDIMTSALSILQETRAPLNIDTVQVGKECYDKAYPQGITPDGWKSIVRNKIFLQAPIIVPNDNPENKCLHNTLNEALGIYAEFIQLTPYNISSEQDKEHPEITIVRELKQGFDCQNEYKHPSSSLVALYHTELTSFEQLLIRTLNYAKIYSYQKITYTAYESNSLTLLNEQRNQIIKNIEKLYPEITIQYKPLSEILFKPHKEKEITIIPDSYFSILKEKIQIENPNYLTARMMIGDEYALFSTSGNAFEEIEGTNSADPSEMLLATIMMLNHIGHYPIASKIHNAWLKTIEDHKNQSVATHDFTSLLLQRMGKTPETIPEVNYDIEKNGSELVKHQTHEIKNEEYQLVGVDIFFDMSQKINDPFLHKIMNLTQSQSLKLQYLASGKHTIWPSHNAYVNCKQACYARFVPEGTKKTTINAILSLLQSLSDEDIAFVRTEHLYLHQDTLGFNLAKGV